MSDRDERNSSYLESASYFPRGLLQPENGFKFSADALLLSCFLPQPARATLLDLGTGCGVVALGALLRSDALQSAVGLDSSEAMVAAATENGRTLGQDHRFQALHLDVREIRQTGAIAPESFDLIALNPPYRIPGSGRESEEELIRRARFETTADLADFLDAAAYAVRNKGIVCMVHLAERLCDILETLRTRRLEPKRILAVHGKQGDRAKLVLVEARKNGRQGLSLEGLTMYSGQGEQSRLTQQALSFCPFLECNA